MKRDRKRNGTPAEIYGKLSRSTAWILLTFLSFVSYLAEVRPFINSSFGIYPAGVLDGLLIAALIVAIVFYSLSKTTK